MKYAIPLIALCLIFFLIGPFLLIWSMNTLFALSIPYTLKTWVAALLLAGAVGGFRRSSAT